MWIPYGPCLQEYTQNRNSCVRVPFLPCAFQTFQNTVETILIFSFFKKKNTKQCVLFVKYKAKATKSTVYFFLNSDTSYLPVRSWEENGRESKIQ